jgi:hypothetical protein
VINFLYLQKKTGLSFKLWNCQTVRTDLLFFPCAVHKPVVSCLAASSSSTSDSTQEVKTPSYTTSQVKYLLSLQPNPPLVACCLVSDSASTSDSVRKLKARYSSYLNYFVQNAATENPRRILLSYSVFQPFETWTELTPYMDWRTSLL